MSTARESQFGSQTVYIKDKCIPFGLKLAPGIFHRLSRAVKCMLNTRGSKATVVYLDDVFVKADTLNASNLGNVASRLTRIKLLTQQLN